MSRGFPSMTALLGLLAVAGYQNRDKISEWLGGLGQQSAPQDSRSRGPSGGLSRVLDQLAGSLAGATPGGILSGGLAELIDRHQDRVLWRLIIGQPKLGGVVEGLNFLLPDWPEFEQWLDLPPNGGRRHVGRHRPSGRALGEGGRVPWPNPAVRYAPSHLTTSPSLPH